MQACCGQGVQGLCPERKGSVMADDACCWGLQGLCPERKVFEVHIEQGHKYGAKVVLRGEAGMSELGVQVQPLHALPHSPNGLAKERERASACSPSPYINRAFVMCTRVSDCMLRDI
jgi:hypothetical protein